MNATPSANSRQRKPRPKPQRSVRLCFQPEGDSPGVVRLAVGREAADYFITPIPADFGRGFKVERIDIDATEGKYAVNIDGEKRSCECKGFGRHGHCKHADGIAALIAAGQL
jgi:hypothetical protein